MYEPSRTKLAPWVHEPNAIVSMYRVVRPLWLFSMALTLVLAMPNPRGPVPEPLGLSALSTVSVITRTKCEFKRARTSYERLQ
ncbi:hypothetical protein EDB80DRAFT_735600 [Ilyonectria destructans]|nr:hypothetical protein EDB80DRAFT_735600 [Ilyonectria destructans]